MALIDTADLISISEATKRGVSALVREAEAGHEQVVLRNNKPVAAVVSMQRLEQLKQLQVDLLDVSLVASHADDRTAPAFLGRNPRPVRVHPRPTPRGTRVDAGSGRPDR